MVRDIFFESVPRLPMLQYTFSEALALLLAVQAARRVSGISSPELAAAVARLEALFPPEFAPWLRRSLSQSAGVGQVSHRQTMLTVLNWALIEQRKVDMEYETHSRGGEVTQRVVRPYALYPHVRSWHLIAYCELRKEVRMFKVDRIRQARLLDEHYTIPADFDVEAYMGNAWGVMRGGEDETEEVVLFFTSEAGKRVAEEYWHKSQVFETQADGRVRLRLRIAVTPEFVSWVLYYGSQVEVERPESLRKQIAQEHQKAAEVNGVNGG